MALNLNYLRNVSVTIFYEAITSLSLLEQIKFADRIEAKEVYMKLSFGIY